MKRLVVLHRVFFDKRSGIAERIEAIYSRTWNRVRYPIRNPIFFQFPRQPLYKEKLRIHTKLRKEFVSQSKEQTSLALSELQKEAKHKTTEIQEQTDGFIENQNALFEKMKKQQKFYKAVSITALAVSIASLLYGIIL